MTENMRQFLIALNEYDNVWLKLVAAVQNGFDTEREEAVMKMNRARLISKFKQVDTDETD